MEGAIMILVAVIAAGASISAALLSRKVEQRTRTTNGHTIGEVMDAVFTIITHHDRDPGAHKTPREIEERR